MCVTDFRYGEILTTKLSWVSGKTSITLVFEFLRYEDDEDGETGCIFAVPGTVYELIPHGGDDPKAPPAFAPLMEFNYNSPFTAELCEKAVFSVRHFYDRHKGI